MADTREREGERSYDADAIEDEPGVRQYVDTVNNALNRAREHRDANLTSITTSEIRNTSENRKTARPKVYYNPDNEAPDVRSSATTIVSMAGEYRDASGRTMQVVAIPAGTKLKTIIADTDSDDPDKFDDMSYEEIQTNLRLLSDVVQAEKLHISSNGKEMNVDDRVGKVFWRWWSGDSRAKTIAFVQHLYSQAEKLCNSLVNKVDMKEEPKENTEKLIRLWNLIKSSGKGLDRLNMTYSDDKKFAAKIGTIKENYETYVDQTLKKTIDGFKSKYGD